MEASNIEATEPRNNFPAVAETKIELEELLFTVPESVGRVSASALTIVHLELGRYVQTEDDKRAIIR